MKRRLTVALVLAFLPAAAALAETTTDSTRFALTGHYQLRIGEKPAKGASIYVGGDAGSPRLLVVAPDLPQAMLIAGGSGAAGATAAFVERSVIERSEQDADSVNLTAPPAQSKSLPVMVDGSLLKVTVEGVRLVLEPREPLVGDLEPQQVLDYMPEYRRNLAEYRPRKGDLRLLEALETPTDVEVFFGTWCPHCEQNVPRLLRVMQSLKTPNLRFHLHGLPHAISEDPLARQYGVIGVPTGVIRRGDKTIARLENENWNNPESALAALLFGEPLNDDAAGAK